MEKTLFISKRIAIHIKGIICAGQSKLPAVCTAIKGPLYVASAHFSLVPILGGFVKKENKRLVLACWEHMSISLSFVALFYSFGKVRTIIQK